MIKKLTDRTGERKVKGIGAAKHSELVAPRRPKTIRETAKLSDMYDPVPNFFKDAIDAASLTNKKFAILVKMDEGAASRLGRLRGLQLAQACWASDALNLPLEDIAKGMGVKDWNKRAVGSTLVKVVGTIDAEFNVHRYRADAVKWIEAPPGGETASSAYRIDVGEGAAAHLQGGYVFRGPQADPSSLRFGPRLAIVRLDGDRLERLRIVQPTASHNAEGAHDCFGLDGRVVEKNRRLDLFQPIMWVKL